MTVREHVERMFAGMQAAFPAPYPVTLRWRSKLRDDAGAEAYGLCWREGRRIAIDLDPAICRNWFLARVVLHEEYAHALTIRTDRMERGPHRQDAHEEEWGVWFARLRTWEEKLGKGE